MLGMDLCPTCRKMLYRTDPCKGVGVECGRKDGGSTKSTGASQERAQTATGVGGGGDKLGSRSRSMATAKTDVPSHQRQASGDGQSQHNSGVRVDPVDTLKRGRGRPRKPDALDGAERSRRWRAKQKALEAGKMEIGR